MLGSSVGSRGTRLFRRIGSWPGPPDRGCTCPVDGVRRGIGLYRRSTVNRDPFADSLLTVACDTVVVDVGLRLRRTGASDRERTPRR